MPKFKPPYFLDICNVLLKNKNDEASMRTVIGRSYYTSLLFCREYLENIGYSYSSNVTHGKIWADINSRSLKIGMKLNMLFLCRLVSDYDLNTPYARTLSQSNTTYTSKCDFTEAKQCVDSTNLIIKELNKNP